VFATIEVRDDGRALSPEFQQKMFEPYERSEVTELPTDSVGLGLTVARTLARLMDGDLTYHHTGEESVFTLSLPRATVSNVA
jgi:two-component system OmpR family sensor kinase